MPYVECTLTYASVYRKIINIAFTDRLTAFGRLAGSEA